MPSRIENENINVHDQLSRSAKSVTEKADVVQRDDEDATDGASGEDIDSHAQDLEAYRRRKDARLQQVKLRQEADAKREAEKQKKTRRTLVVFILSIVLTLASFVVWYGPLRIDERDVGLFTFYVSLGFSILLLLQLLGNKFRTFSIVELAASVRPRPVLNPADAWPFPSYPRQTSQGDEDNEEEELERYDPFEQYFREVQMEMVDKAETANETAARLLQNGTTYTIGGIIFFFLSIIYWQVATNFFFHEFQTQHIYGIVSCSGLFIFIEAISAWYLRQYRHYVDTATYLLKVKAMFDRYLLQYHAIAKFPSSSDNNDHRVESLLRALAEPVKWPESNIFKNTDRSHLEEALSVMTTLLNEIKQVKKVSTNRKARDADKE